MVKVNGNKVYLKTNDSGPVLEYTCVQRDGTNPSLTGATVTFHMRDKDGVPVTLAGTAALGAVPTSGQVQYTWAAADTAAEGIYGGEFEITMADTTVETFPKSGYISIVIVAGIA